MMMLSSPVTLLRVARCRLIHFSLRRNVLCFSTDESSAPLSSSDDDDAARRSRRTMMFPWRHTTELLPRIETYDDLSRIPNHWSHSLLKRVGFAFNLDVPVLDGFLFQTYRPRLASEFAWAFQRSLACLLSSVFQVRLQHVDRGEDGVQLESGRIQEVMTDEEAEEVDSLLGKMLERNLRGLYKKVEDPSSLEVTFRLKPLDQRLLGTFFFGMMSRDKLKEDPEWYDALQKLWAELEGAGHFSLSDESNNMLRKIMTTNTPGPITVFSDVAIDCLEVFQVRDKATGSVLQGSETLDPIMTTHLVRFEMVTTTDEARRPKRKIGSWQIVDWDDMLDGNIWY